MKQTISIIGFGWLGLPLAQKLQAKGYSVIGSTTSHDKLTKLDKMGVDCRLLNLTPHPEGSAFNDLFTKDILIINIPPRTRKLPETFHPEQIKFLKAMAIQGGVKQIIYVSATSVYPDENQKARETDNLTHENTGNKALWNAENLLWKDKSYDLTVIRFGGLLGVDRIPGKYFSGKENVNGNTPVNYIHRDDAVNMVIHLLEKNLWNQTFNGVSPEHPIRRDIYEKNASEIGFPPPVSYLEEIPPYKVIVADKILKTGFEFIYSNPLTFSYEHG